MAGYKLTSEADADFAEIYRYSVLNFGLHQAIKYAARLTEGFELLTENPRAGSDYFRRPGTRRLIHERHSLYYVMAQDTVVILRILSHHQDPLKHL